MDTGIHSLLLSDSGFATQAIYRETTTQCSDNFSGIHIPIARKKIIQVNDLSYGTYIYHMPVINMFVERGLTGTYSVFIYSLALTLLLSGISWKYIEQKFIRMKRKSLMK